MKYHRINELIELLQPEWKKEPNLNLMELISLLARDAGYEGDLSQLTDDVLIYHLKLRNCDKNEMIPGIAKDCEDDFKTAILRNRGIIE